MKSPWTTEQQNTLFELQYAVEAAIFAGVPYEDVLAEAERAAEHAAEQAVAPR